MNATAGNDETLGQCCADVARCVETSRMNGVQTTRYSSHGANSLIPACTDLHLQPGIENLGLVYELDKIFVPPGGV